MKKFIGGFLVGAVLSPILLAGAGYAYLKVLSLSRGAGAELAAPVLPMTEADYDWSMETVAGDPVSFEEYRGKVVFLTFFKPSCGTCQSELPHIQALYDKVEGKDIEIVMVSQDPHEDWLGYMEEHAISMPVYVAPDDYPNLYHTGHVPSTFILDRNGRIAARFKGAAAWDDDSAVTFLEGLAVAEPVTPAGGE